MTHHYKGPFFFLNMLYWHDFYVIFLVVFSNKYWCDVCIVFGKLSLRYESKEGLVLELEDKGIELVFR